MYTLSQIFTWKILLLFQYYWYAFFFFRISNITAFSVLPMYTTQKLGLKSTTGYIHSKGGVVHQDTTKLAKLET